MMVCNEGVGTIINDDGIDHEKMKGPISAH